MIHNKTDTVLNISTALDISLYPDGDGLYIFKDDYISIIKNGSVVSGGLYILGIADALSEELHKSTKTTDIKNELSEEFVLKLFAIEKGKVKDITV